MKVVEERQLTKKVVPKPIAIEAKVVPKPIAIETKVDASVQFGTIRKDYMALQTFSPHSSDSDGMSAFKVFRN
jgi:hypothetical protein